MKFHGCAHLRDFLVRSQFYIYAHDLWNESIIGIFTCRDFRERERRSKSRACNDFHLHKEEEEGKERGGKSCECNFKYRTFWP